MLILRAERYVRQAHNLKVVGSNPTPATKHTFYLNKKYEIVVTIKTIITQIERLARICFSLELDCKKLGSTNINTPIKKIIGII